MEMTNDEARTALEKERKYALHENKQAFDIGIDVMCKYQMMQADYENRLKADMVAMLTEIQLEIEEVKTQSGFDKAWDGAVKQCSKTIQQKIDALRGNNENSN